MFAGDSTDAEDIRVLGLATVELAIQSSMTSVVISPLVRDLALVYVHAQYSWQAGSGERRDAISAYHESTMHL